MKIFNTTPFGKDTTSLIAQYVFGENGISPHILYSCTLDQVRVAELDDKDNSLAAQDAASYTMTALNNTNDREVKKQLSTQALGNLSSDLKSFAYISHAPLFYQVIIDATSKQFNAISAVAKPPGGPSHS